MNLLLIFSLLAAAVLFPLDAFAETPRSATYDYSPYEQQAIDLTLERLGLTIEPYPEGKTIERIEIVSLEVIEPRDPAPGFLNIFHTLSRRSTIERELLLHPGSAFRKVVVDETARNLRALPQLSVVLCVPVRGTSPNHVGLVVITKDIWSLRLNSDIQVSSGGLELFVVQPSEINLFGSHHTASARFELNPAAWSTGALYIVPRLTDHLLSASASANIIVNRDSGQTEGSFGGISLGRPLIMSQTPWSWQTSTSWRVQTTRRFVAARLATFDATVTPEDDEIPYEYRTRRWLHRSSVTRSYGWAVKNDVSFGAEYDRRQYALPPSHARAEALQEFRDKRMPTSFTRLSPFVEYAGYTTDFMRVLDFETLGLQEDFRLGHSAIVKLYPASEALGSTRTLFGAFAAAQYTLPFVDGLVRANIESATEWEPDGLASGSIQGRWRVITPRLGFGRLLVDALVLHRYRNFLNELEILGGQGRLRGYPSNYFVGQDVVVNNLEFRSRPLEILTLQLEGAVFYDAGVIRDRGKPFDVYQSTGFGMRALFPQLDRVVFRVDVGFPLAEGGLPAGVAPAAFYAALEQAFPMPNITSPP
ncbi:MAG TPA: BamA/TamA family outer membrane protein [Polyangiaceae bacterium]|nr:BamA/TamA family outer membrane protein [Polyangiaceae bacterium]